MDGEIVEVRVTCSYAVRNVVAENIQKGLSNMGFLPVTFPRYYRSARNDSNTLIYQSYIAKQLD